jgi:hypothetical protein
MSGRTNSKNLDDYNSIMADRLRKRLQNICTKKYARNLGYSADEVLTAEGMIAEEYRSPSYSWLSTCPDHLENQRFGNY